MPSRRLSLLLLLVFLSLFLIERSGYRLLYQPTGSLPRGFYLLIPSRWCNKNWQRNELVAFYPPKFYQDFLIERKWLPKSGIMMKYAMGIPHDYACNSNDKIIINHKIIGGIKKYYSPKKILPKRIYCARLKDDQYLLLNTAIPRSFDGRYFGPIDQENIIGKTKLLFKI